MVGREMLNWSQAIFRLIERCNASVRTARRYILRAFFFQTKPDRTKQTRSRARAAPPVHRPSPSQLDASHDYLEEGTLVYAIGDVHGRADLLNDLLDQIDSDAEGFEGQIHIVFLGDYIDRGLQSRQVIEILLSDRLSAYQTHFLKGNHEDALLSFLGDPEFGPKWAAYGGRETLVSYGVKPPRSMTLNAEWHQAHDNFLKSFPNNHQQFFRALPTRVKIGGYGFVHAGMKPGRSFDEQSDYDLMWIRDEFLRDEAGFDVKVVHGHTPTDAPYNDNRRINVDTGAYFTGRLTAVKLVGQSVDFIATDT